MGTVEASQAHAIAGGLIALVWAIGLQLLEPDRVHNAAAYATRIEDVAPAAPVDLGL